MGEALSQFVEEAQVPIPLFLKETWIPFFLLAQRIVALSLAWPNLPLVAVL